MEKVLKLLTDEQKTEFLYLLENYEVGKEDYINVPYEGTSVQINDLNGMGLRVLKTIYNDVNDLRTNIPDFDLEEYLFRPRIGELVPERKADDPLVKYEPKGTVEHTMFDYVPSTFRGKLGECFGLLKSIEDNFGEAEQLSFTEIVNNSELPEEVKALCFSSSKLDVSDHLSPIDEFVSETNNEKGESLVYTLYKGEVDINGNKCPLTYVKCPDGTTNREFYLQVYNRIDNAKDAAACLVRYPKDMHEHIVAIYRQGDVYPVVFNIPNDTEEFKNKMGSEKIPLFGDEYFSKLVYES